MRTRYSALVLASVPTILFAQDTAAGRNSSPFMTAVITWIPFIALIALWWYFMRKLGGKKGYTAYITSSQEHVASIDQSLKQIARSMEQLVENSKSSSSGKAT